MADRAAGVVIPIGTASNKAGRAIKVGSGADAIAITPNSQTVYVLNLIAGTVTPIRVLTGVAEAPINVGSFPYALAVTP